MFNKKLPVPTDRVLLEDSDEKLETNSRETSELEIEASSSGSGSADSHHKNLVLTFWYLQV